MRWICFVVSETKRRCGFFLDVFGLTLPEYLECDLFPESEDSDVCVGHREVVEADKRAQKPGTLKDIELLWFVVSRVWLFDHDFRKTMIFTKIYLLNLTSVNFGMEKLAPQLDGQKQAIISIAVNSEFFKLLILKYQ